MGLPSLLLAVALLVRAASGQLQLQRCRPSERNYTAGSAYESNLRRLLSTLVENGPAAGYYLHSVGGFPDTAYGAVLCRGDADARSCRQCLQGIARDLPDQCPNKKIAIKWDDDCLLRYTDQWSFPSISGSNDTLYLRNTMNVPAGGLSLFNNQLERMMGRLAAYAAYGSSGSGRAFFATGEAEFTAATPIIYGLVQCTTDQSPSLCHGCLTNMIGQIRTVFFGWIGARTLGPTCYFRYEVYSFYRGPAMVSIAFPTRAPAPAPTLLPSPSQENQSQSVRRRLVIIATGSVLGLITVACLIMWKMKASKKIGNYKELPYVRSLLFNLSTLRVATDNFSKSNKLGEGGFGAVYKGTFADGRVVAVKRLSVNSRQGLEQMRNEVVLLAKQEHRNLVRLMGVCLEEEKLLIYEYMPNTSLDKFLFDPTKNTQLVWQLRYKIIQGVARGLLYLHEESRYAVIHRDLKASNILLDANMNPKISDFGISRLFSEDQTHESASVVAGTFGYMAPEYVFQGQFSNKSDVFSFGVLVLELVTGRSNSSFSHSEGSVNLLSYVWEHWTTGAIEEVIDPSLSGEYQQTELLKCIYIGLLCVQESPADRPTMSYVVLTLDGLSTTVHVLSKPAFYPGQSEIGRLPKGSQCSLNELDISDLDPR